MIIQREEAGTMLQGDMHHRNTNLTSLPLVSVCRHGRVLGGSRHEITPRMQAPSSFVHNLCCSQRTYLKVSRLGIEFFVSVLRFKERRRAIEIALDFVILSQLPLTKIEVNGRKSYFHGVSKGSIVNFQHVQSMVSIMD